MPMATMLSPGVTVREYDLTQIVPQSAAHNAAFVGDFNWGPVDEITTLGSEEELIARFGLPTNSKYYGWFACKNYLDYSRNLKVVRVVDDTTKNATDDGIGLVIKTKEDYVVNFEDLSSGGSSIVAGKYPGAFGNGIIVSYADAASYDTWDYKNQFLAIPGTSDYATNKGGSAGMNDEIHVVIVDGTGAISGVAGRVLERFPFCSKASDAKYNDGTSAYYVDVIRDKSRYVWVVAHPDTQTGSWGLTVSACIADGTYNGVYEAIDTITPTDPAEYTLSGGVDTASVTDDEVILGWNMFKNKEAVDVGLLIVGATIAAGNVTQVTTAHVVDNIAEYRKDCVAFISPNMGDVVNNYGNEVADCITTRNVLTSSSYAFMDCNWKYQFDPYNDTFRWLPCNPDIAGLAARTDEDRDPWWSPAGFNRGHIKNVVKLAWNPTNTDRDELYVNGVNPVVTMAGEGTLLYGDKTMLTKPSAFDRINVRRLFIVLEKAISKAAQYQLFEFNDAYTRLRFIQMVEPFLRDVQGRRGIVDFKVVCDETNNTPYVIDSNSFVGDIYIKPSRSINFITLNFIAVGTGVEFTVAQTMFADVANL